MPRSSPPPSRKILMLLTALFFVFMLLIGFVIYVPKWFRIGGDGPYYASAVGYLRTLNTSIATYHSMFGDFPPSLQALGPPATGQRPDASAADLIDEALASGQKSLHIFVYRVTEFDSQGRGRAYTIHVRPMPPVGSDSLYLFTDETGIIRSERGRPADRYSPDVNTQRP